MEMVTLGSTGIKVNKNGFGALPIQRLSFEDAIYLVRKAYKAGFTYFDTARDYTDSEEKLGQAFDGMRNKVFIASKTHATDVETFWNDLNISLRNLKTTYIDVYQFHNPSFCPKPGDGTGLYEAMLEAKKKGMIKHIGITNHRLHVAKEAVLSGLYETLQYPFSYVSGDKELELVELCKKNNMGFVAMKGLSGGLLTDYRACYAFEAQFDNVLPIWGIQREKELDQWISCITNPPVMTNDIKALIEKDRKELSGDFCRSCGYCMPCTVGIEINQCARMSQLIRRSPSSGFLTEESQKMMLQIEQCVNCGKCKAKCPYGLDIPALLKKNLEDYKKIISGEIKVSITPDARN